MQQSKKNARLRRSRRTRMKIGVLKVHRVCVHRTPRHIYAQIISPDGAFTVACASTVEAAIRAEVAYGGNLGAASVVGRTLAERARKAGVEQVAFDRSGFKYHGRMKALADAAREGGLKF